MVMRLMIRGFVGFVMMGAMVMTFVMHMHHWHHVVIVEARRRNLIATNRVGKTWTEDAKQVSQGNHQPRSTALCPGQ